MQAEVTWIMLNANAGLVSRSGLFTAGEVAGSFDGAIQVTAAGRALTSTVSVKIVPGPVEQVGIAPNRVELGMGMTQRFVALGADRFGNRISGLKLTWRLVGGGGVIDRSGFFTAGFHPGSYKNTVKASATQGQITRSVTATVTVEPDRIAFLSRRDVENLADPPDIYIMNADGSDVKRVTKSSVSVDPLSWSPDGRRIAYVSGDDIVVSSDDGAWKFRLPPGPLRSTTLPGPLTGPRSRFSLSSMASPTPRRKFTLWMWTEAIESA